MEGVPLANLGSLSIKIHNDGNAIFNIHESMLVISEMRKGGAVQKKVKNV